MSLLDKREVQDIGGHTALRARKWSGFICKRASDYRARSTEERRIRKKKKRRMPNSEFLLSVVHT